jgi:hypothetical protein
MYASGLAHHLSGTVPVQPPASAARNIGTPVRSSIARAVRGASGLVAILPPLRVILLLRQLPGGLQPQPLPPLLLSGVYQPRYGTWAPAARAH